MRILVVDPGKKPEVQEIDGTLSAMQELVGGSIQAVYPFEDTVALVANEEGKLMGLPMNRALRDESGKIYDIVCGTFFLCGLDEENFISLTDAQVEKFSKLYAVPDAFIKVADGLLVLTEEREVDNEG